MHLKLYGRKNAVLQRIHYWLMNNIDELYEDYGDNVLGTKKDSQIMYMSKKTSRNVLKARKKKIATNELGIEKQEEIELFRREKFYNYMMDNAERLLTESR